jgi:hypothetical protein
VENELATIYFNDNKPDSAKKYASLGVAGSNSTQKLSCNRKFIIAIIPGFREKRPAKAYDLLKISVAAKDTVTNVEKIRQVKQLEIKEKQRVDDLHLAEKDAKDQVRFITTVALLVSALVNSFILYRNNRNKQKANLALQDKNDKIERTVSELNTAQASLLARNAENELLLKGNSSSCKK